MRKSNCGDPTYLVFVSLRFGAQPCISRYQEHQHCLKSRVIHNYLWACYRRNDNAQKTLAWCVSRKEAAQLLHLLPRSHVEHSQKISRSVHRHPSTRFQNHSVSLRLCPEGVYPTAIPHLVRLWCDEVGLCASLSGGRRESRFFFQADRRCRRFESSRLFATPIRFSQVSCSTVAL